MVCERYVVGASNLILFGKSRSTPVNKEKLAVQNEQTENVNGQLQSFCSVFVVAVVVVSESVRLMCVSSFFAYNEINQDYNSRRLSRIQRACFRFNYKIVAAPSQKRAPGFVYMCACFLLLPLETHLSLE